MQHLIKAPVLFILLMMSSCNVWTTKTEPTLDIMITKTGSHNRPCQLKVIEVYGKYIDADVTARIELINNTPNRKGVDVYCVYTDTNSYDMLATKEVKGVIVPGYSTILLHVRTNVKVWGIHSARARCSAKWK